MFSNYYSRINSSIKKANIKIIFSIFNCIARLWRPTSGGQSRATLIQAPFPDGPLLATPLPQRTSHSDPTIVTHVGGPSDLYGVTVSQEPDSSDLGLVTRYWWVLPRATDRLGDLAQQPKPVCLPHGNLLLVPLESFTRS